ncbi:uncharacterized protein V6R79_022814 [Siganus canaliculatus]
MLPGRPESSLQTLVLTPDRIPVFLIPSRPLVVVSPGLLVDRDDLPGVSPAETPSSGVLPRPPPPGTRCCRTGAAAWSEDTDLTTRAAMSLPHLEKVTTPYGFRAVLAASPCTRRRESLFHQRVALDQQQPARGPGPGPGPGPCRSPVGMRPVKTLGQRMKELRKPALCPAMRRPHPQ